MCLKRLDQKHGVERLALVYFPISSREPAFHSASKSWMKGTALLTHTASGLFLPVFSVTQRRTHWLAFLPALPAYITLVLCQVFKEENARCWEHFLKHRRQGRCDKKLSWTFWSLNVLACRVLPLKPLPINPLNLSWNPPTIITFKFMHLWVWPTPHHLLQTPRSCQPQTSPSCLSEPTEDACLSLSILQSPVLLCFAIFSQLTLSQLCMYIF